ncbi:flagellar assembly protein FliH [Hydrogenimonas thermophila]|uniref:Flagellar assembly protein FliH n=1 Tax=Hydrogenimonas thermophila TaxID=223786 RepID=A0A1I5Q1Y6_9BACT|nr:flagellar assembly protein FliH [Hydrogenimonas thermophila]WOE70389.1 flagellar assembly protein FliH [Hydrogenimonas thermophila]WOE72904.1 flagellar assembly protein FliH [Hydrogenimonas thermophila]SFP40253.1 flagellar assembly protein FliH [Hydrogenimonas thermophila]
METVIPPDRTTGHVIQKYHFKILTDNTKGEDDPNLLNQEEEQILQVENELPAPVVQQEAIVESSSAKDEMLEQMLKKADELSTNLVKMQMQLEKQQEEFEVRLKETREAAYEEGKLAGKEECESKLKAEVDELRERLAHTIASLDESRQLFLKKVDTIEEELIETALDLAKQVVVKEIDNNSKEVALRLAKLLLTEVKDASKVTLKVNPNDYTYVKESLEQGPKIEVTSDPAVGPGGVIVISDVGNIDGEIMHRFERIKEAVFGTLK